MSKVIGCSCFSSPCSIERNAKSVSVVTVIALVALAAVAVGVLAILANLPNPPQGLGVMSEIGMKGGIAMTAAGGALFIATLIVAASLKSKEAVSLNSQEILPKSKNKDRDKQAQEKAGLESLSMEVLALDALNFWIALYTKKVWEPKLNEQLADKKAQDPDAELTEREEKGIKKAATAPVIEKLKALYGSQENLPTLYNCFEDPTINDRQFDLLLLSHQKILDLSCDDIAKFDQYQIHILIHRLMLIESSKFESKSELEAIHSLHLWQLREIEDRDTLIKIVEKRPILGSLLSAEQIAILLEKPKGLGGIFKKEILRDPQWIHRLLPVTLRMEQAYTQMKLKHLSQHVKTDHLLSQLPPSHLILLPVDYFTSAHWQWTPARIKTILIDLRPSFGSKVVKIVQSLGLRTIQDQVESLTVDHFQDFTAEQLRFDGFPWLDFSQKAGWGRIARNKIKLQYEEIPLVEKGRVAISPLRIPLLEMAPSVLKEFFKPEADGPQKQDLKKLTLGIVLDLVEIWELKHLQYFSNEHRNYPRFPWDMFYAKEGIGTVLRSIYAHSQGLESISLGLYQLSDDELGALFSLADDGNRAITRHLLSGFKVEKLKGFAHALTVNHLPLMPIHILKDPAFPWKSFITKPGIGTFLYQNSKLTLGIQDHIPWDLLPDTEIKNLFPNIFEQGFSVQSFFQKFKVAAITKLAPKLEARYITRCSSEQLNDSAFPWLEFVKKTGIGAAIRQAYEKIVLINIPWTELTKSEKEMADLLVLQSKVAIANFLQAFPNSVLSIIHTHIPVHYLEYFSSNQLINLFPWKEFIAKPGIGKALSSIIRSYEEKRNQTDLKRLVAAIPWELFAGIDSVELIHTFSVNSGYINYQVQALQAMPIEHFKVLVKEFGRTPFDAIVKTAVNGYQKLETHWFTPAQQDALKNPKGVVSP